MKVDIQELWRLRSKAISMIKEPSLVDYVREDVFLATDEGWLDVFRFRNSKIERRELTVPEIKEYIVKTSYFNLKECCIPYSKVNGKEIKPTPSSYGNGKPLNSKREIARQRVKSFLAENGIGSSTLLDFIIPCARYTDSEIKGMQDYKENYLELLKRGEKGILQKFYRKVYDEKYLDIYGAALALADDYMANLEPYIVPQQDIRSMIPEKPPIIARPPKVKNIPKPVKNHTEEPTLPDYERRVLVQAIVRSGLEKLGVKEDSFIRKLVPLYKKDVPLEGTFEKMRLAEEEYIAQLKKEKKRDYIKTTVFIETRRGYISRLELFELCQDIEEATKVTLSELCRPLAYYVGSVDDIDTYTAEFDDIPDSYESSLDYIEEEPLAIDIYSLDDDDDIYIPSKIPPKMRDKEFAYVVASTEVSSVLPDTEVIIPQVDMSNMEGFQKYFIKYSGKLSERDKGVIDEILKNYATKRINCSFRKIHANYDFAYNGKLATEHLALVERIFRSYKGQLMIF